MFTMLYEERNMKNINKLAPKTRETALKWYGRCKVLKVQILITETLRTLERQKELVAQKRSQTLKSYHIVGQALDFVPVGETKDKLLYSGYNAPKIKELIEYAKSLGFEWGGDWTGFIDMPHLQFNYKGYGTDKEDPKPVEKAAVKPTPKPKLTYIHKVVKGDTLSGLAKKYKTTVANLKKLNSLKDDVIKVGQKIKYR